MPDFIKPSEKEDPESFLSGETPVYFQGFVLTVHVYSVSSSMPDLIKFLEKEDPRSFLFKT
jgi:hypothetical protein